MINFLAQRAVDVICAAATLYYFGFVRYAIVALIAFVVVLSVFTNNERTLKEPEGGYELPPQQRQAIDLSTRIGLAGWCGAVWPSLAIGAAFGWQRAAWK